MQDDFLDWDFLEETQLSKKQILAIATTCTGLLILLAVGMMQLPRRPRRHSVSGSEVSSNPPQRTSSGRRRTITGQGQVTENRSIMAGMRRLFVVPNAQPTDPVPFDQLDSSEQNWFRLTLSDNGEEESLHTASTSGAIQPNQLQQDSDIAKAIVQESFPLAHLIYGLLHIDWSELNTRINFSYQDITKFPPHLYNHQKPGDPFVDEYRQICKVWIKLGLIPHSDHIFDYLAARYGVIDNKHLYERLANEGEDVTIAIQGTPINRRDLRNALTNVMRETPPYFYIKSIQLLKDLYDNLCPDNWSIDCKLAFLTILTTTSKNQPNIEMALNAIMDFGEHSFVFKRSFTQTITSENALLYANDYFCTLDFFEYLKIGVTGVDAKSERGAYVETMVDRKHTPILQGPTPMMYFVESNLLNKYQPFMALVISIISGSNEFLKKQLINLDTLKEDAEHFFEIAKQIKEDNSSNWSTVLKKITEHLNNGYSLSDIHLKTEGNSLAGEIKADSLKKRKKKEVALKKFKESANSLLSKSRFNDAVKKLLLKSREEISQTGQINTVDYWNEMKKLIIETINFDFTLFDADINTPESQETPVNYVFQANPIFPTELRDSQTYPLNKTKNVSPLGLREAFESVLAPVLNKTGKVLAPVLNKTGKKFVFNKNKNKKTPVLVLRENKTNSVRAYLWSQWFLKSQWSPLYKVFFENPIFFNVAPELYIFYDQVTVQEGVALTHILNGNVEKPVIEPVVSLNWNNTESLLYSPVFVYGTKPAIVKKQSLLVDFLNSTKETEKRVFETPSTSPKTELTNPVVCVKTELKKVSDNQQQELDLIQAFNPNHSDNQTSLAENQNSSVWNNYSRENNQDLKINPISFSSNSADSPNSSNFSSNSSDDSLFTKIVDSSNSSDNSIFTKIGDKMVKVQSSSNSDDCLFTSIGDKMVKVQSSSNSDDCLFTSIGDKIVRVQSSSDSSSFLTSDENPLFNPTKGALSAELRSGVHETSGKPILHQFWDLLWQQHKPSANFPHDNPTGFGCQAHTTQAWNEIIIQLGPPKPPKKGLCFGLTTSLPNKPKKLNQTNKKRPESKQTNSMIQPNQDEIEMLLAQRFYQTFETRLLSKIITISYDHLHQCMKCKRLTWFTPVSLVASTGCIVYKPGLSVLILSCYLSKIQPLMFNSAIVISLVLQPWDSVVLIHLILSELFLWPLTANLTRLAKVESSTIQTGLKKSLPFDNSVKVEIIISESKIVENGLELYGCDPMEMPFFKF